MRIFKSKQREGGTTSCLKETVKERTSELEEKSTALKEYLIS